MYPLPLTSILYRNVIFTIKSTIHQTINRASERNEEGGVPHLKFPNRLPLPRSFIFKGPPPSPLMGSLNCTYRGLFVRRDFHLVYHRFLMKIALSPTPIPCPRAMIGTPVPRLVFWNHRPSTSHPPARKDPGGGEFPDSNIQKTRMRKNTII